MNRKRTWSLAAMGLVAVAVASAVWVRRRFVAITVEGMSMSPSLYPGDKVLIRRGTKGIRPGSIVVMARPRADTGWRECPPTSQDLDAKHWFIKRVVAVAGDEYPPQVDGSGVVPPGHVVVLGDHPRSEDSKQHGPCPVAQILGVQIRRLSRRDDTDELPVMSPDDPQYLAALAHDGILPGGLGGDKRPR